MDILEILSFSTIGINCLGVVCGIIFGFLPGLSCTMAVAVMMPFTFSMPPVPSFALLLGVYVGSMYGGSVTAILIKTPGTPNAVVTTLDGYPMAQQGRAKEALSTTATVSFIGGIFSCALLVFLAEKIANFALQFGPPEYFAVGIFGLSVVSSLSANNILKGVIAACFGIMLGTIGVDPVGGLLRYTFGIREMIAGMQLVAVVIGIFAVSEILTRLEKAGDDDSIRALDFTGGKIVSIKTLIQNKFNLLRSALIGTVVGIIPGTGGGTASWISYNEAVRASREPETFGKGNVSGIVASETANNAVTGGALVPLLTLGVPGDTVTAVMLGALMIQGLSPGPTLFSDHPDVVSGIYIMLIVSNIFMLIFGLIGVALFVKILKVPNNILMSCVLLLCMVGSFAMRNNAFDIKMAAICGVIGYFMVKGDFPLPPALLGLILGGLIESNFRRSLVISGGEYSIFLTRPICTAFLIIAIITFMWPIIRKRLLLHKARLGGVNSETEE